MQNIVSIYKPKGITSHDVIDHIRLLTGVRTVGHAGTLDPLASGVLVVGIGREATKQLAHIVAKEKEYEAIIYLGVTSTTDDEEGEKTEIANILIPSLNKVEKALKKFIGTINQFPPIYSALKIKGIPAHRRVRAGENIILKERVVEIKNIMMREYAWPLLKINVVTGPGVYIRALARDIGWTLKVGGYLFELERTRVGEYTKDHSLALCDADYASIMKDNEAYPTQK